MSYILSTANRFYAATEAQYGELAPISANNRFPALHLHAQQGIHALRRHDKNGTRTFAGAAIGSSRVTHFELEAFLTSWSSATGPSYGPLFEGVFGNSATLSTGLTIANIQGNQLLTIQAHNLAPGSAVSSGSELRFAVSVPDAKSIILNAPFTFVPQAGSVLAPVAAYRLGTQIPGISLFDYWDPTTAVSRIITGAAMDTMQVSINSDFQMLRFSGPSADLLDSATFVSGTGGLAAFPAEPALNEFNYSVVTGQLGQIWFGSPANHFFTLTAASITLKNNVRTRGREYGSAYPQAITPGQREVSFFCKLLAQDDPQTVALYMAAKQRATIPIMLQIGNQPGQMMAIYMPNLTPELPNYNDSQTRLIWEVTNSRAQGTADDELFLAFG